MDERKFAGLSAGHEGDLTPGRPVQLCQGRPAAGSGGSAAAAPSPGKCPATARDPADFSHAYEGQGDDFIGVDAYHEFGIATMRIMILDNQGNLIENGDVYPYEDNPNLWWFFPEVHVPLGTKVIAHVTGLYGRHWQGVGEEDAGG